MILFNINELETRLIKREVTDKLAFTYLLFHLVYMSVLGHLTGDEDPLWAIWAHLALSIGTMLWGLNKTYEINQQGDNSDYFKRFLSLSFVAGLRSFLIIGLTGTLINMGIDSLDNSFFQDALKKELMELLGYSCFLIFFYYLLLRSFRRINS